MFDTTSGIMTALNVLTGLGVVLATIATIAWGLKRFGLGRRPETQCLKIIDSLALSPRDRILIIEVLDQWIIVGMNGATMTPLHTMSKPSDSELALYADGIAEKIATQLNTTQSNSLTNFTEILTAHLKRAVGKKKRDEHPEKQ